MALLQKARSLPRSTKILLSCLTSISFILLLIRLSQFRAAINENKSENKELDFREINVPFLQLVPRFTIFYPWVVVTAIFCEVSVLPFIFSIVVLGVASSYIERFWGYKEVLKFVLIIGSVTNFITVITTIVSNLVRKNVLGMNKPLGGGISYYFGFLVVFKQIIPEHNIVLFQGLTNVRVKNLPFFFLIVVSLWSLFVSKSLYPIVPSFVSFFVAFCYLRFYQSFLGDPLLPITSANVSNESGNTLITGDASDTFQLAEFFPSITKSYVAPIFNGCYELACFLGIITPFNDDFIEQSNIRAQKRLEQANQAQKSIANSVAERRRQVALQVIEERINKGTRS